MTATADGPGIVAPLRPSAPDVGSAAKAALATFSASVESATSPARRLFALMLSTITYRKIAEITSLHSCINWAAVTVTKLRHRALRIRPVNGSGANPVIKVSRLCEQGTLMKRREVSFAVHLSFDNLKLALVSFTRHLL